MKNIIRSFFMLILGLAIVPNTAVIHAEETWTHFTGDRVTIPDIVRAMAIDHDGVLWAGGAFCGMWRYDGVDWETVWKYDSDTDTWETYPGDEPPPCQHAYSICVDQKNVKWFAMCHGIASYDGTTVTSYEFPDYMFFSSAVDHDNVKWFGTEKNGVWSFDGKVWQQYTEADGIQLQQIWDITVDKQNGKWFTYSYSSGRDNGYGILHFDGSTWTKHRIGAYDSMSDYNNTAKSIAVCAEDSIWVGTSFNGIYLFNGETFENYRTNEQVSNIAIDNTHAIWFTMSSHGAMKYTGDSTIYDSVFPLHANFEINHVVNVIVDKYNTKWFGTDAGISRLVDHPTDPVAVKDLPRPETIRITGNYPNPFNPETTIQFTLDAPTEIRLAIYDITGRKVTTLAGGSYPAGSHAAIWDGSDSTGMEVASGVYFARLVVGGRTAIHRMLLVR